MLVLTGGSCNIYVLGVLFNRFEIEVSKLLFRGMIENLIYLLQRFGYVPNGGRIYYTRSQPPLLASMVWDYYTEVQQKHVQILHYYP